MRYLFSFIILGAVAAAVFASATYAGSVTPSAAPAATGYTLEAIYNRLLSNATTSAAAHDLNPTTTPAPTFHTLTQIYNLIPTIDASKVLSGTSYLGVSGAYSVGSLSGGVIKQGTSWGVGATGTLTPDGGTATAGGLFAGLTAQLTNDWTLDTGTLTLACATTTFDGTANLVNDTYDGGGDGTNRWCMTNSGDALAADILSGKVAWVDGLVATGTMPNIGQQLITPATTNQTISAGYHDGTGYCAGDADIAAGNIKSGVNIFGTTGNFAADLPACSGIAGAVGEVWAKHTSCSWATDACRLGATCAKSCAVVNQIDTTTSYQTKCGTLGTTLVAANCDLCVIK